MITQWNCWRKATPHTRGSTHADTSDTDSIAGYPAYAGIDLKQMGERFLRDRLPRIRGDRPLNRLVNRQVLQATPHTRGSILFETQINGGINGYPAYAGIDPL